MMHKKNLLLITLLMSSLNNLYINGMDTGEIDSDQEEYSGSDADSDTDLGEYENPMSEPAPAPHVGLPNNPRLAPLMFPPRGINLKTPEEAMQYTVLVSDYMQKLEQQKQQANAPAAPTADTNYWRYLPIPSKKTAGKIAGYAYDKTTALGIKLLESGQRIGENVIVQVVSPYAIEIGDEYLPKTEAMKKRQKMKEETEQYNHDAKKLEWQIRQIEHTAAEATKYTAEEHAEAKDLKQRKERADVAHAELQKENARRTLEITNLKNAVERTSTLKNAFNDTLPDGDKDHIGNLINGVTKYIKDPDVRTKEIEKLKKRNEKDLLNFLNSLEQRDIEEDLYNTEQKERLLERAKDLKTKITLNGHVHDFTPKPEAPTPHNVPHNAG